MADERDPKVSKGYRELGADEPSRALDEAIVAAARRAVDARPAPLVAPTGRRRWYFPVAAAAVITLAVAVTVQVERQKPGDELVVATAPPQAQKEERAAPQVEKREQTFSGPAAEQPKPAQKPMRSPQPFTPEPPPAAFPPGADAMRDLAKSNEAATAAQGARPSEAPAVQERARARSDAVAETRRMEAELQVKPAPSAPASVARAAPAPQAKPAPDLSIGAAGAIMSYAHVSPEKALEQIAELRKQGKHEEADKALAEFRKRYPEYRISEEMLRKVEKR